LDSKEATSYVGKLVRVAYWDHTGFSDKDTTTIGDPVSVEQWGVLEYVTTEPVPHLVLVNERTSERDVSGSIILLGDVISIEAK